MARVETDWRTRLVPCIVHGRYPGADRVTSGELPDRSGERREVHALGYATARGL